MLPGAVLVLLPKCPLCLAAWLTAIAGVGVSATAAAHLRTLIVVLWVAAVALAAARIIRRRAFR
jgi:MYXO-CTERM domain-containing protein